METTFFNYNSDGTPLTFQVHRDPTAQKILFRAFGRQETTVSGVRDGEFVFDPAFLRAHPDHGRYWTDHMCWVIENREDPSRPSYCRALYPFTMSSGAPDPDMRPTVPRYLSVFVPFADSRVEEMVVLCYVEKGLPLIETDAKMSDRRIIERDLMPSLTIELPAVSANEAVEGTVRMRTAGGAVPPEVTVYLESSAGYLPSREVKIRRGEGRFKFVPLHLAAGDEFRIRAGFKFFPDKTSFEGKVR